MAALESLKELYEQYDATVVQVRKRHLPLPVFSVWAMIPGAMPATRVFMMLWASL